MREQNRKRAENVRLVRLPNGKLVMQNADSTDKSSSQAPRTSSPPSVNSNKSTDALPKKEPRKTTKVSDDHDIGDVWEEQIKLKEEAERLELEYEIAKKMAKELKKKIREREQPYDATDPAFRDLLSPEVKDFGEKLQPHVGRFKEASSDFMRSVVVFTKKWAKFFKVYISKKLLKSKKTMAISAAVVAIVFVGGGFMLFSRNSGKQSDVQSATVQEQIKSIPLNTKPDFPVLIPFGKTADSLGGLAKVSPQGSAAAYAYVDKIEDIKVKVTQQELPERFKKDTNIELEKTAKDFNAKRLVQVDQTILYLGESDKGPQTGIFTKDGLLVFVTAEDEVSDVAWVQYVTNLKKQ